MSMRIAITLGDPNGIGPEVAIKAAQHFARARRRSSRCWSATASSSRTRANRLGLDDTPPFVDAEALDPAGYAPGTLDPRAGKATVGYVETAVRERRPGCAFDIAGKGVADPTGVIETTELLAGLPIAD